MDSGIRSGTDVLKALALGAKAVLLGRPYVYGLGPGGGGGGETRAPLPPRGARAQPCALRRRPGVGRRPRDARSLRLLVGARVTQASTVVPVATRGRRRDSDATTIQMPRDGSSGRAGELLEIHEAEGAFERIEGWLRDQGFFAPGGETLVADLYLGYGLSETIRRTRSAAPPEPCPLPLAACAVRSAVHDVEYGNDGADVAIGRWQRTWPGRDHAAAVEAVREAIARGDVYQVNLVQHLSAPFSGDPRSLAARLAPLTQPNDAPLGDARGGSSRATAGRSSPASPELFLSRRGRRASDAADQGDAAARRPRGAPRIGEGRRRARHDRRPRAQRPLARLRARQRPLAGADGRRGACRRRASRLDRRGRRCGRKSASRSSSVRASRAAP